MQACIQISHINYGKNILAQRRHCILNVCLPPTPHPIITTLLQKPHNVTQKTPQKITLLLKCSMAIISLSRELAVNGILHHGSLFSD